MHKPTTPGRIIMLDLSKLGQHQLVVPESMATCWDFIAIWSNDPNRAQLARLCAGAIGVCVDHAKVLPAYRVADGDPIAYGHTIMDRLMANGVTPGAIYELGVQCIVEMTRKIPTQQQVEETANFTHPPEAN